MLSATMHSGVSKLAKFSLHQPVSIGFDIGENGGPADTNGSAFQMPKQLKQYYMLVPTKMRPIILYKLVAKSFKSSEYGKSKIVVPQHVSVLKDIVPLPPTINRCTGWTPRARDDGPQWFWKVISLMTSQPRTGSVGRLPCVQDQCCKAYGIRPHTLWTSRLQ